MQYTNIRDLEELSKALASAILALWTGIDGQKNLWIRVEPSVSHLEPAP